MATDASLKLYQSLPTVQKGERAWVEAAKAQVERGQCDRARLLLATVLSTGTGSDADLLVQTCLLQVQSCLQLGNKHWPEALAAARSAMDAASARGTLEQRQRSRLALAVALGHMARTPVMAQPERSAYRAEAREVLQADVEEDGGSSAAHYSLAVVLAEGGHYDASVAAARAALGAAPKAGAERAAALALLALLLSARQQLAVAVQLADAGLSALPGPAASGAEGPAPSSSPGAVGAPAQRELQLEVLLLRIKAHALLALADTNGALTVLGAAKRRLTAARGGAGGGGAAAPALAAREAQVWRDLAAVYAGQAQVADAGYCVAQAAGLEEGGAATLHSAGVVAEAGGETRRALDRYQTALAVDSTHAPTLLSLGTLLRRQGRAADLCVAASLLTDALRYEPHNPVGWYNLGLVRKAQGHSQAAEEHLFSAVQLAAAAPVLSYSQLPLLL